MRLATAQVKAMKTRCRMRRNIWSLPNESAVRQRTCGENTRTTSILRRDGLQAQEDFSVKIHSFSVASKDHSINRCKYLSHNNLET